MNIPHNFRLLWPDGHAANAKHGLDERAVRDLALDNTISGLGDDRYAKSVIREVLLAFTADPAVIAYRQDIIDDLLRHPQLLERLDSLMPQITALDAYRDSVDRQRRTLQEITWRLGELEQFVESVEGLQAVFRDIEGTGVALEAAGWRQLKTVIETVYTDETYQRLARELPDMALKLREYASVTVGINLDKQLRPVAATLLSVNKQPFVSSSLLDKLFGRDGEGLKGMGPLHTVPQINEGIKSNNRDLAGRPLNPLMVPLFNDLAKILDKVTGPIAKTLRTYISLNTSFLARLRGDIVFYLSAVRFISQMRKYDLPLCRPEIAPLEARVCEIDGGYNPNLALHLIQTEPESAVRDLIVNNAVQMGDDGRIMILTGPNQGGKTTYTQMVGLCQVLAQAGLHIPGRRARLSPADAIYTHYPVEEQLEKGTGRFGDEAQRFSHIFERATRHSLILLNEPLSSTSPGESLYLAQDIVKIMRRMGVRAIFNTHMHALAAGVDDLNADVNGDSMVVSLVASLIEPEQGEDGHEGVRRSYRIIPSPPMGRSYAREIARRYGISYEQLSDLLAERGVFAGEREEPQN